MKKFITLFALCMAAMPIYAQLGAPKITARDTLVIMGCIYNQSALQYEDWPSTIIIEDAVSIQIADYVYKKGKPKYSDLYSYNDSWNGHIDYVSYDARCNGKVCKLSIIRPREDCESEFDAKIVIDDYDFYVVNIKKFRQALQGQ